MPGPGADTDADPLSHPCGGEHQQDRQGLPRPPLSHPCGGEHVWPAAAFFSVSSKPPVRWRTCPASLPSSAGTSKPPVRWRTQRQARAGRALPSKPPVRWRTVAQESPAMGQPSKPPVRWRTRSCACSTTAGSSKPPVRWRTFRRRGGRSVSDDVNPLLDADEAAFLDSSGWQRWMKALKRAEPRVGLC